MAARTGGRRGAAAILATAFLSFGIPGTACTPGGDAGGGTRDTVSGNGRADVSERRSIADVQEARADAWEALDGVVGTGIGRCDGDPCIKVFVRERSAALEEAIPAEAGGYPVRIEVTGSFRPRDTTSG